MADASVLGRIVWYELLTTDMKAALVAAMTCPLGCSKENNQKNITVKVTPDDPAQCKDPSMLMGAFPEQASTQAAALQLSVYERSAGMADLISDALEAKIPQCVTSYPGYTGVLKEVILSEPQCQPVPGTTDWSCNAPAKVYTWCCPKDQKSTVELEGQGTWDCYPSSN